MQLGEVTERVGLRVLAVLHGVEVLLARFDGVGGRGVGVAGPAHYARNSKHFCSTRCIRTTHGQAGTRRHKIWEGAKKRAKENGVLFCLTVHDIPDVPTVCPVLGIPIRANEKAGPLDSSPSLDRIRPTLGYVPGNVRIISNRANRIRSDATAAELSLIAWDALALEDKDAFVRLGGKRQVV